MILQLLNISLLYKIWDNLFIIFPIFIALTRVFGHTLHHTLEHPELKIEGKTCYFKVFHCSDLISTIWAFVYSVSLC